MSPLSRDFQQLQQHVAASGLAACLKLVSVDGGTVNLTVTSDNRKISCTIFFVNDSDYPHSPLMAMCEDDDRFNSALEAFGDEFDYGAPLLDVISRLCTVFHLDAGIFDQLRAGSADQSDEEAASEEDYSDNGQDMAETDNQVTIAACNQCIHFLPAFSTHKCSTSKYSLLFRSSWKEC